jgi:PAS domain S-box-containing protein
MNISIRNLSIRARFFLLLGIIIVIVLLIAGFFIFTLNRSESYKTYNSQIDQLSIHYLNMRRFEQHFLLRYSEDPAFFTTGENTYIKKLESTADNFDETLETLEQNPITEKLRLKPNYVNIRLHKDNYLSSFIELTENTFKRGSRNTGITGEMHKASEQAADLANSPIVKKHILEMQKISERYLVTQSSEAYRAFLDEFKALNDFLSPYQTATQASDTLPTENQSTTPADTNQIAESNMVSAEFAKAINDYKQYFLALRKIDLELGLTYKEGLEGKLREEIHKIDPEMELITKRIRVASDDYIESAKNAMYIFLLFISILLIGLIWQFFASVSKPLNKLYAYTQPLSKGILPKKVREPKGKDEAAKMHKIVNKLIEGLKKTTDFATMLGKGVFDTEYEPLSDRDALGNALIEMRQNLNRAAIDEKRRKREDDTRKWVNEGIAKFNDILRQSPDDIEELSNRVIKELVNYLGANQGAMYVFNDTEDKDERYLDLTAAYAYGKEKKRRNKVYPGEGLLGTAAVEKESIYMTDIPDSYLNITSGLGHANPRSLLIVPMKVEEDVFGVVEIASFKEFKSHQIKFTEEVSDNIASSLSMTKINLRTTELLKQSQIQAEQMSRQEQEMRQNFEELQEAQEESARREAEMASILSAIDNSSLVLEIDDKGTITSANRGMLELLGIPEGQIVGMQHNDFINIRSAKEYNDLWDKLRSGDHIRRTENIKINNKEFWLSTVYAPIKDESGKIINIMALGTDLTEPKQLEIELKRQAEALSAQEEEMRQNLEELHATQDEMSKKQLMLENANSKLKKNEKALKSSIEKSEKQEKLLQEKVNELNIVQEQIQEQHNSLIKTNEELEQKEKEIRNRFDAVDKNNLVAEYQPNGMLISANATFLSTFGYNLNEVKDKHQRMFIPEKTRKSKAYKELWAKLRNGEKINEESKRVNTEGELLFFKGIYTPILDLDGNPIKILEILTDITQQKSTESQLISRNKNIDSTAAVIEFDVSMKIIDANENFCKSLNYTKEEITGKEHAIFVAEENRDSERYLRFIRELKRGNSISDTFMLIGKNDSVRYMKGTYSGVKDPSGKTKSIIFNAFDITDYELAKQEIKDTEQEVALIKKKYSKLLADFLKKAEALDEALEKQIIENYFLNKKK